jgi:hypothetical protein
MSASLILATSACGGGGGGGSAPAPTRETWVVALLDYPLDATQADSLGFDLDGDGTVDNQMGNVFSALTQAAGSGGLDLQGAVDAAVDDGSLLQLVETRTGAGTAFVFQTGTPAIPACTNPLDPVTCRRHLNGSTRFTATAAVGPALTGPGSSSSAFQAGPGEAVLQFTLMGGPAVALPLKLARASFTRSGATLDGKVGGAIPQTAVDGVLVPGLQVAIETAVARDCPGGTCISGSTGETMLSLFDDNGDGAVSLSELQGNPIISTLLRPDVDTNGDHVLDALSMGLGYHLVGAVY